MSQEVGIADIGLIGLAVMGQNLILNMNDHGFVVCAYNRTKEKVTHFLENEAKGTKIVGAYSVQELCMKLKSPRKVMMLVKAGPAVDAFIKDLLEYLEEGDIIIDGGNSHYPDTIRRTKEVNGGKDEDKKDKKDKDVTVKEIFQAISAKVDGEPCCDYVGQDGAGHFVKMVHNGIEYGDMQMICEAYHILKETLGLSADELSDIFTEWNKGELDSYLIEITRDILKFKDTDGSPLVEHIKDTAGQKGTGKWTVVSALDTGSPVTLIGEAVFARCLSAIKSERVQASKILPGPNVKFTGDKKQFIHDVSKALYASKIISYAQGFMLMREAAKENNWKLNYSGIALMWRGGCIIRSVFLGDIKNAYTKNPELENLLFDPFFTKAVSEATPGWRNVVSQAALQGIPAPALSAALAFYDGYRHAVLPANLLQAQRDYFGAHTYQRLDNDAWVHTNWTGRGGNVSSTTYLA
ncbi:6-phosphogluconate dehydrogenase, decarboxylating [Entomortierella chlamydospora]|uniref:6-phosphogluconate dehydrogenase, decarboxylating n=1 Tax=Entomortierella chlamydospora TaxID=101097 RepID=A0A9P6N0W7_9FUNG|nr:6-phosphogluconate dehydrogenase, decarboxylating [Entomortierella chlamydospora]